MSDGWRPKRRLTMPPAPRRKPRYATAKHASLQLDEDDPMMERAAPTDGGFAPLTTSSSSDDEAKSKPTMARITPGVHDEAATAEAAKEEAAEAEETKEEAEETKEAKALDLLAHEPPLASPRTPSYEEEPSNEEELSEEAKDHVHERDTAEEMGHDE